ncbi:MAG: amidohydrolase family protein [Pseudomonadota bacterium]
MIIDFHTHIFPPFFLDKRDRLIGEEPAFGHLYGSPNSRLVGREALLENMDEEGIHRSVIFGFPWEDPEHFCRHNDYIIESVKQHPDRLVGFCCFSPLSQEAPKEAERCLEAGLSGVGEMAVYHSAFPGSHPPALRELMEICSSYDVPVLLHSNEPVGHFYPGKTPMILRDIYHFLKSYPSNRIVLAHWGGGLFFYALMKKEVREVLQNVWFDTAASPYLYIPDIYRIAGEIIGFEKVLFGSDYPLLRPSRYFHEMKSADLPPQAIRKMTGENAALLLRLSC